MALSKSVTIPQGYPANYFSITRVDYIDEETRDARFIVKLFRDKSAYNDATTAGFAAGYIRLVGAAFDLYFSKAAMDAANQNVYKLAYQAAMDITAAKKAKAAYDKAKAAPAYLADLKAYNAAKAALTTAANQKSAPSVPVLPALPSLTPQQETLASHVAQIVSDYNAKDGTPVFDGATTA